MKGRRPCVAAKDKAEADRAFTALNGGGGKVTMPLANAPWGPYFANLDVGVRQRARGCAQAWRPARRAASVCYLPLMAPTKDEAVRELAEWHFGVEPDLKKVIRIVVDDEDAPDEPIKLLEVNAATVATGSVEPYAFAASASVPFPTVIAEVTPEEYERIRRNEIKLPAGWSLTKTQLFERPQAA